MQDFESIRRDFLRKFSDVYDFLYNCHDNVAGFTEAMEIRRLVYQELLRFYS